ncbi:MAG: xylulokinase [Promethearchaeota archaeon]
MSKKEKYILAIDHGTSGAKTALVSVHGKVIDWVFKEVPLILPEPNAAEQDPDDWWSAIKYTATKLVEKELVPVEDIVGVCNTSQWSGTVALDKDGNHLMNAIIWMDTRGAEQMAKLHKSLVQVSGYSLSKILKWIKIAGGGPTLSGKDPIAHILWLKENKPEIYEKTSVFLEPQDYVNYKFTGEIASSFATIHMHWITDIRDINNIVYSEPLMKILKVTRDKFPRLLNSTDILGPISKDVADELGLEKTTKLVVGAPDLHAATVGSGAVENFAGHLCIGTSNWLLCHVPYKKTDIAHNMASLPSAFPGRYMLANEQEIAGGALTFIRDNILYHKDELLREENVPDVYKIFDKIVERVPAGSEKLIFTPWLFGERSPIDDHVIRGGLYNINLTTNREHLIRAVFEGVAYNARWLLYYVEKFINRRMDAINIIGGGAQSDVWCQIFADVMRRTIRQVKNPIQANSRGAAFIASVGLGYIQPDDISKHIEFSRVFKPNKENENLYNKLFKTYLEIYKVTRKIYKKLNEN